MAVLLPLFVLIAALAAFSAVAWEEVPLSTSCADSSPASMYTKRRSDKVLLVIAPLPGAPFFCNTAACGNHSLTTSPPESGMFSLSASNPFLQHTWLFLPYCTGDFFLSDVLQGNQTLLKGLEAVLPFLNKSSTLTIVGAEGGGIGVLARAHSITSFLSSKVPYLANNIKFVLDTAFLVNVMPNTRMRQTLSFQLASAIKTWQREDFVADVLCQTPTANLGSCLLGSSLFGSQLPVLNATSSFIFLLQRAVSNDALLTADAQPYTPNGRQQSVESAMLGAMLGVETWDSLFSVASRSVKQGVALFLFYALCYGDGLWKAEDPWYITMPTTNVSLSMMFERIASVRLPPTEVEDVPESAILQVQTGQCVVNATTPHTNIPLSAWCSPACTFFSSCIRNLVIGVLCLVTAVGCLVVVVRQCRAMKGRPNFRAVISVFAFAEVFIYGVKQGVLTQLAGLWALSTSFRIMSTQLDFLSRFLLLVQFLTTSYFFSRLACRFLRRGARAVEIGYTVLLVMATIITAVAMSGALVNVEEECKGRLKPTQTTAGTIDTYSSLPSTKQIHRGLCLTQWA